MAEEIYSPGLEGVIAGETAISTVSGGLTYRGYSIEDLAEHATFEEVAYLLLYGELPNRAKFEEYRRTLQGLRGLPGALKVVLEQIPAAAHPMDVLRTDGCGLGCVQPEA